MVAATGVVPEFIVRKAAIFPVPLAANPMEVVLFVQSNCVAVPENATAVVETPLQTVWSDGSVTVGVGLTVMVKV